MPERADIAGRDPAVPEDAQQVRVLGGVLVARLHGVLRGLRLYDASNRALHAQQQDLLDALRALPGDDVSLLGMGEYFYVNGVRLRPEGGQLPVFRSVLAELEARRLHGLRFSAGLELDELGVFLRVFHATRGAAVVTSMAEVLDNAGVSHIAAVRAREVSAAPPDDTPEAETDYDRHRTRLVFRRAVSGTRDLMMRTARTGRPALQQARRVVQPIVDRLLRREDSLIGLTALKHHDEYTYAHCVNVSILSIRMGQLLGLSRSELASLGVAALLHDAGKIAVPADVLRKPGKLEPEEWEAIRRHPVEGLKLVSRLPGLSDLMLDSMRVAFEHHMNVDHSGYPSVARPRGMGSHSRIVAVADCFDAVTSHRSYRKRPMTAHEALRLLVGREAAHFDRAVLWALVHTVGLYPAGSLLRTEAGRLFLSVAPSGDDPRRPMCRELVAAEGGGCVATGAPAPLEPDETVSRVLAPEDMDVDVEGLLAA
jgi:HD-GYP domain-containing protein (c-di-GMP phosphodiesterase class II)